MSVSEYVWSFNIDICCLTLEQSSTTSSSDTSQIPMSVLANGYSLELRLNYYYFIFFFLKGQIVLCIRVTLLYKDLISISADGHHRARARTNN